ncbi:Putative odorant receptor 69a, isoform A [Papilio xuthus]|uniref:Putative odorant receptor 69a, isoform A n=1 Tax=Papilio xuthus TaxID=66420 RepID=A0A194PKL6_PAPXU|nr:Putative odorant receptor 69a, isoform A [Papilio xuthus]
MGTVVYLIRFTNGYLDTVKSYLNILVYTVVWNAWRWLCFERKGLRKILELIKNNNDMPMQFERSTEIRKGIFKYLKTIVLICYALHFFNEILIYLPKRLAETAEFSIVSCVGLEPISESPNKEICKALLTIQLFGAMVVVVSYDTTFLFLFGYTASMFSILREEIMSLDVRDTERQEVVGTVENRLKNIVNRHSLTLHTVENIQNIYNFSIGVSVGEDAITMCLFFVMPLNVSLNFIPLLIHDFLAFFLYCYQGQKITTAAERFEMEVYSCGWENFGVKEQKMILTMLRQSQKPVIINAASVVPICIYTFACTMQSIYKFGAAFKS